MDLNAPIEPGSWILVDGELKPNLADHAMLARSTPEIEEKLIFADARDHNPKPKEE
jgi:hypothetical protein